MGYCANCGKETNNTDFCLECGHKIKNRSDVISSNDRGGILYFLIGVCIPIVGLILFLSWNTTKPKSAKAAGLGALLALPIIMFMGVVSAFAIPAVATIIENAQKDVILADALVVENGAKLFCSVHDCDSDQTLTWTDVSPYIEGLDTSYYEIGTTPNIVVATNTSAGWTVSLERAGYASGNWEFDEEDEGVVPSSSGVDRYNITPDTD